MNPIRFKFQKTSIFLKVAICFLLCIAGLCYAAPAVQLPDGTYVAVRDGETPQQAYNRAQKMYPDAFEITLPPEKKMDMDWYNDCIYKASTSPNMSNWALHFAVEACEYKAVPKKCRAFAVTKSANGRESGDARGNCVEQCRNANYYSKSVGECSKG